MEMIRLDTLEYINKIGFGNNMPWDGNIEKNTTVRAARLYEISIQEHVHYRSFLTSNRFSDNGSEEIKYVA